MYEKHLCRSFAFKLSEMKTLDAVALVKGEHAVINPSHSLRPLIAR